MNTWQRPLGPFGKWLPIVRRKKALVTWTVKLNVVFLKPGEGIEEDVLHFLRAVQDVGQQIVVVVAVWLRPKHRDDKSGLDRGREFPRPLVRLPCCC